MINRNALSQGRALEIIKREFVLNNILNSKKSANLCLGWGLVIVVIIICLMLIFSSRPKVPLPTFSIAQNSILPGEEIVRGSSSDSEFEAIVTDHVDAKDEIFGWEYSGANHIWIHFDDEDAASDAAGLMVTIIRDGEESEIQKDTKSPHIVVEDLPYGVTEFTIIAENTAGKVEKRLKVTKTTHRAACDADLANKTHRYCSHFYQVEPEEPQKGASESETSANSNRNFTQNTTPSSEPVCIHFEAGRCWDDIEDEAYDYGRWDKEFGRYGDGYNPPDDCTGLCEDIYDDAYHEGYDE